MVYLSEKENLLGEKTTKRIGKEVIRKNEVKKVKELSEQEAQKNRYYSLEELKKALQKWHHTGEESTITFIEFELKLE